MVNTVNCNKRELQGAELKNWLEANKVGGSRLKAEMLYNEIGCWDSIECTRSRSDWPGTGYKTTFYRAMVGECCYEVSYQVTGPDSFRFSCDKVDLKAEEAERKAYGRKVSALAKKSGVPWKIVALLKNIDAAEDVNLAALNEAKAIHEAEAFNEKERHELSCGINRRKAAIARLLEGHEAVFGYEGQVRSSRLAGYLAGYEIN